MFMLRRRRGGLTLQEAIAGAQSGAVAVIDLREPGEVARTGKARGALEIPLARLAEAADPASPACPRALRDAEKIALYCASGARSRMGASVLRRLGYDEVYNIGGLGHWQRAGGAVEHE
ncbi:MAG TPA: sulfurtransferase [Rhodobacteraceae bacterium]|nr:sulfurtransferase [Paracoccaceae bacterium]